MFSIRSLGSVLRAPIVARRAAPRVQKDTKPIAAPNPPPLAPAEPKFPAPRPFAELFSRFRSYVGHNSFEKRSYLIDELIASSKNVMNDPSQRKDDVLDIRFWTQCISGCSRTGQSRKAHDIYSHIVHNLGLTPDVHVFSALIACDVACEAKAAAFEWEREMVKHGVQPQEHVFTSWIDACSIDGDVEKALAIFAEMNKQGLKPNVYTWTALIKVFCKVGDLGRAVQAFETMQKAGITPTAHSWGTLMGAFAQKGDEKLAFGLIERMKRSNFEPTMPILNPILELFCSQGQIDRAIQFLEEVPEKYDGVTPNAHSFAILSKHMWRHREDPAIREKLEAMITKLGDTNRKEAYALLMKFCEETNDLERANKYWQKMEKSGIAPHKGLVEAYFAVLKACKSPKILEITDQLVKTGLNKDVLSTRALQTVIETCAALGDPVRAVGYCSLHNRSIDVRNTGLAVLAEANNPRVFVEYHGLSVNDMVANNTTFKIMLTACARQSNIREATRILAKLLGLDTKGFVPSNLWRSRINPLVHDPVVKAALVSLAQQCKTTVGEDSARFLALVARVPQSPPPPTTTTTTTTPESGAVSGQPSA